MTPREYVKKYEDFKDWKFNRNSFEEDIKKDFEFYVQKHYRDHNTGIDENKKPIMTITKEDFRKAINEFHNQKWNKIFQKVSVDFSRVDSYWNYIYATVICVRRDSLFPITHIDYKITQVELRVS